MSEANHDRSPVRQQIFRAGARTAGDLRSGVLAAAAVVGALVAFPVPSWIVTIVIVLVAVRRRFGGLVILVALLTSMFAAGAWAGLAPPSETQFTGSVTLVSDPAPSFGSWTARVRTSNGYFEARVAGRSSAIFRQRLAGQRLMVRGRIDSDGARVRDPSKHVRGRLVVERIESWDDGGIVVGALNGIRSIVLNGAVSLPSDQRALFGGFVLGDDRGASDAVKDDFKASGLTHLLVVSGENLAFVLVVLSPLLSRVGLRSRFAITIVSVLLFAALTRFEPSILRASCMVCISVFLSTIGRPASGIRTLAFALVALVLIDPLLVRSVGFRLSVAATFGIVAFARILADRLPFPRIVSLALGVTISAQLSVAPFLIPMFGPMPVVAIPANVLAEPAAALVMMWGCSGGVVAGLVGPGLAALIHVPTRLGLWWVMEVARIGARAPLGSVGLLACVGLATALVLVSVAPRISGRRWLSLGAVAVIAVVLFFSLPRQASITPGEHIVGGASLWRGSGSRPATVLVISGSAQGPTLLAGLRTMGIDRLDLLIVRSTARSAEELASEVRSRFEVGDLWAPGNSTLDARSEIPSGPVTGGSLRIKVARAPATLEPSIELLPTSDPVIRDR